MRSVIVDGNNNFIRQYVANPTLDSNGEPVGGTIGLLRNLRGYIRDLKPDRLVLVWDGEGGSQRRRGIYSEYKAGRKVRLNREYDSEGGAREDLGNMLRQFELSRKYAKLLGVPEVRVESVEADDVIAYLCNFVLDEDQKTVVTSDHDMYQLINDKCEIFNPLKKEFVRAADVVTKHGALPENYIIIKAMVGDASDNVKGIKGLGEKGIRKLIPFLSERVSSFDEVFAHAQTNVDRSPKYRAMIEAKEMVLENASLMQLSNPIISTNASRSIREQLTSERSLSTFTVQMELIKDGLQFKEIDFFGPFKELEIKKRKIKGEG